jgi:hypothetical protein
VADGFNINELNAELARSGVMRNNKFLVEFPMPLSLRNTTGIEQLTDTNRVLSLYCEGANLPGIALLTEDIRRYGYGPNEKKPYAPIFTDVNLTFRGDSNGNVWTFMNAWMKAAVNYEYRTGMNTTSGPVRNQYPSEVGYKFDWDNQEGYVTDTTIHVFDDTGAETIKVVLREAFPIFVGDIPLNWSARSDYMRIPVTLSFFDWYNELVPTNNTQNTPTQIPDTPTAPL